MNKSAKITTAFLGTALTTSLFGSWTLIDDFETVNPDTTYIVALGSRESPQFRYEADPQDASNKVFFADPVTYGTEWTNIYMNWPLPTPINDGATGTLYLRYYSDFSNGVPVIFGLTDIPAAIDSSTGIPTAPTGYAAYESAGFIEPAFSFRDANAYVSSGEGGDVSVWWEVWMVIDNQNDWTTVYLKGPNDSAPRHIQVPGDGGPFDEAIFRNGTSDPLVGFFYALNAGDPTSPNSGNPVWIDDVYYDPTGENLESPIASSGDSTWGGYPIVSENQVDTGDWLGWLSLKADSDWTYSYTLNQWLYLSEPAEDASGAWVYVSK